MSEKERILVTGGAGYIGTTLVPLLLERGHCVTIFDRLLWGSDPIVPLFRHPRFNFIKGDVRDKATLRSACKNTDAIVHLAAIVGYPACDTNPKLANNTNVGGAKNLACTVSRNQHIIFISSESVYGRVFDRICTEDTPPQPLTRYGRNKMAAERILMNETTCTTLRPCTAFGLSPRLRMDLLIHELALEAFRNQRITLYEGHALRPFIHIRDFGRAVLHVINHRKRMRNNTYNLGIDTLTYTKRHVADLLTKHTGAVIVEDGSWKDPDKRHYRVSHEKIRKAGFRHTRTLEDGVLEILRALPALQSDASYSNAVKYL